MYSFGNLFKRVLNLPKTDGLLRKTLKYYILLFVRRFYNPNLQYADTIITKWINSFVTFFLDISLHGVVFYLTILSFIYIFPWSANYVHLGTRYWIPVSIYALGLVYWFVTENYKWFRKGYKGGKK